MQRCTSVVDSMAWSQEAPVCGHQPGLSQSRPRSLLVGGAPSAFSSSRPSSSSAALTFAHCLILAHTANDVGWIHALVNQYLLTTKREPWRQGLGGPGEKETPRKRKEALSLALQLGLQRWDLPHGQLKNTPPATITASGEERTGPLRTLHGQQ